MKKTGGKGKVAIVGGGASGMVAAIFARRSGADVTVFDLNPNLGRKILKTGGGRCNFANEDMKLTHFHTGSKEHVKSVFSKFSLDDILTFMSEIGITPKSVDGWYYPHSMQARSVRDCLLMELEIHGVRAALETKINGIRPDGERFVLDTGLGVMAYDGVILATGGMAAPESGSDGNGFYLAKSLGHTVTQTLPALCPLMCEDSFLKKASGIRIDATVTINADGKSTSETGNLQITEYGISGICTMQLSHLAAMALANKIPVTATLDFVPELKKNELSKLISERFTTFGRGKSSASALVGLLPDKLITCVLIKSAIKPDFPAVNLSKEQLELLCGSVKSYPVNITDVRGFSQAQTTLGGVDLNEIDKNTMLSKKYKNLGFCGEIVDVCGDCGGYNIAWAISSGAVCGKSILGGL